MEIVIRSTSVEAAATVADIVERYVRNGNAVLGLATGSSPVAAYRELGRRHRESGLDFGSASAFLLDEYIGLPPGHPQSYRAVIRRDFVDHVNLDPHRVYGPNGNAEDVFAESARYDAAIAAAGGVDVQLLGIGGDGHIGFNEPGSSLSSRTRVKVLTDRTRKDNARFFESADEVPRHALTQGLGTILEARHLVLIACGEAKADAIAAAVEGPLTAYCPASAIQLHPHCTVVTDEAAAAGLRLAEYYRYCVAERLAAQPW